MGRHLYGEEYFWQHRAEVQKIQHRILPKLAGLSCAQLEEVATLIDQVRASGDVTPTTSGTTESQQLLPVEQDAVSTRPEYRQDSYDGSQTRTN